MSISVANITVDGNISLGLGSELHLSSVRLVFADAGGKRSVTGPATSLLTIDGSTVSAQVGPAGGGGYYFHTDGVVTIDSSIITGLSGPQFPTPFVETEGIHLTTAGSSVTNCTISGAQGYAITLSPSVATFEPRISDNIIQNSGGGVFVGGYVIARADAIIERNAFSFNTFPHIVVTGSNPRIANNSFFGSTAGVAVAAGSPTVEFNTFAATLLAAVTVQGGGGTYTWNTISATGIAFQFSGATATLRNNTVTLSASFLQASASTLTLSHNSVAGALGPAVSLNGSTVTGRADDFGSTVGSPALAATNASVVRLSQGSLRATGASALTIEGGSATLTDEIVAGSLSAIDAQGAAITLTNATMTAGASAPALSLRGGSLVAKGGEVTGGSDGVFLDNASADVNGTAVRMSAGWGVRSIHRTPTLSADALTSLINGHGAGDLLVEADLTAIVRNAALETVSGASVDFQSANGAVMVSGLTGPDGRAGPVRLRTLEVDSLNNEARLAPYFVRASIGGANRGSAVAALVQDQEIEVVLRVNNGPSVNLTAPDTVLAGARFEAAASATDPEGDALSFEWSTDDEQHFSTRSINLSFDAAGAHTITLAVSDGVNTTTLVHHVLAQTPAEANHAPRFGPYSESALAYEQPYSASVVVTDDDGEVLVLFLRAAPLGASVSLFAGTRAYAELHWSPSVSITKGPAAKDLAFNVSIEAWDGLTSSFLNMTLLLHVPADAPPTLSAMPDVSLPGGFLVIVPSTYAADGDDPASSLRYTASVVAGNQTAACAAFITVGSDGIVLLYIVGLTPVANSPETSLVVVRVTDPAGAFAESSFNVTVPREAVTTPTATGESGTLLLATLLAAAALGTAAFALIAARVGPKKE